MIIAVAANFIKYLKVCKMCLANQSFLLTKVYF